MKKFLIGFQYALRGVALAFISDRNIRVHVVIAFLTIAGSFYYNITSTEWCIVILCIGLVITTELVNTSIEDLVDLVTTEWKPLAGKVKDIAAGAVLVASIAALIIGLIIFRKHVI